MEINVRLMFKKNRSRPGSGNNPPQSQDGNKLFI